MSSKKWTKAIKVKDTRSGCPVFVVPNPFAGGDLDWGRRPAVPALIVRGGWPLTAIRRAYDARREAERHGQDGPAAASRAWERARARAAARDRARARAYDLGVRAVGAARRAARRIGGSALTQAATRGRIIMAIRAKVAPEALIGFEEAVRDAYPAWRPGKEA